jgi:hypothetical protein
MFIPDPGYATLGYGIERIHTTCPCKKINIILRHTRMECCPIRLLLSIPELQLAGPGVVQGPSTLQAAPPPVNLHVRLQVVLVGKAHLAQVTLEPLLAAVYQLSRHHCTVTYFFQFENCAGISEQSVGARNRVGIGFSYRPARLHEYIA